MAIAVAMPRLGMTMREGRIVEWLARPGEPVRRGQPLLRIESEKAEVEIEAPADGVLRHIYAEPGQMLPCGTLLAAITADPQEPFDPEEFRGNRPPAEGASAAPDTAGGPSTGRPAAVSRRRRGITPRARKRAQELGVDLDVLVARSSGRRITEAEVEAYAASSEPRVRIAPGVELEVPATGTGEPVVLLPGFGTDASVFAAQVPVLAQTFRVLGIHPRGVGRSSAPGDELLSVECDADDVAAVLRSAAAHPAHLIGASLGSLVALVVALRHPDLVRSLALITPFSRMSARGLAVIEAWCAVAEKAGPETLATMLSPWFFAERTLADTSVRERMLRGLAATVAKVPPPVLRRRAAGLRAWAGCGREALATLKLPVLVVTAGEDVLVGEDAFLRHSIPGARHVRIEGAGHAVMVEAPDALNQALLAHIRSAQDAGAPRS